MRMHERMELAAIVNGLRKSGAINDAAVAAIAEELRAAADVEREWGHTDQVEAFTKLADAIAEGKNGL